jgi:tetratricopeptide (TPR) repeat protein
MPERHPAHEAVRTRLILAATTGNCDGLLTAEAEREAAALADVLAADYNTKAAWALGQFHWFRYMTLPSGEDLDDYLAAARLLAPVYAEDPEVIPSPLRERFEGLHRDSRGAPADPRELISRAHRSLNAYQRGATLAALDESVALWRTAIEATPGSPSERAALKSDLGAALKLRYDRTGDVAALTDAIGLHRDAVASGSAGELAGLRSNLAGALLAWHEVSDDQRVLTEAAALLESALADVVEGSAEHATLAGNLLLVRTRLSKAGADNGNLAAAIDACRRVLADLPADDPGYSRYLSNLSTALQERAERTGDRGLAAEALQLMRAAVAACPGSDPERPAHLSNLAVALVQLPQAAGEASRLHEAAELLRAAVSATADADRGKPSILGNYATTVRNLGERTGQGHYLREAVEAGRRALELLPGGHQERPAYLSNLGLALQTLYHHTGDSALLTEALTAHREAVELAAPPSPRAGDYQSMLGGALLTAFEQTENAAFLTEAVETLQAATAPGQSPRAGTLTNLGLALYTVYEETGQLGALRAAVQAHRDAIRSPQSMHSEERSERAGQLSNLGIALQELSEATGDGAPLAEAADLFRAAVGTVGDDHAELATYLVNLGNVLQKEEEERTPAVTPDERAKLAEAIACYSRAAGITGATAHTRVYANRQVTRLAARAGSGAAALAAAEAAAALLPQIGSRSLPRRDRERQIGGIARLPGDAAAAAISAGRPDRAVELLEQTRGLLAADTLLVRAGQDELRANPAGAALAGELERLRQRMQFLDSAASLPADSPRPPGDRPADKAGGGLPQVQAARDAQVLSRARQDVQRDWDDLTGRIRASGHADFLMPPGISELAEQAGLGPIVFTGTSGDRGYALILSATAPLVRVVPLPGFTEHAAYQHANQFREARLGVPEADAQAPASHLIHQTLEWLWDVAAAPVLSALGYDSLPASDHDWPRVWWCPIGITAYLPLHAAGHHADLRSDDPALFARPRTVLDRVISSYTPTVQALARARAYRTGGEPLAPLVVAVPNAMGTRPIPGAAAEAEAIATLMPGAKILANPTRGQVLAALPHHGAVHFACHGDADLIDPGASELVLPDHQTSPLTLRDITGLRLNAKLAFLSACETQLVRENLADEALHLTGGFLYAGYQNVIGTLWNVKDGAARELAIDFYFRLQRSTPADAGSCARALHHAICALRSRYLGLPSLWVAHTHTGV